jgi:hypothetical protein
MAVSIGRINADQLISFAVADNISHGPAHGGLVQRAPAKPDSLPNLNLSLLLRYVLIYR